MLTPFDDDGSPDTAALALQSRWLLANGCNGLSIFGTTGEANSLSVDERLHLMEKLVEDGIPGQVLLPGTGCCAVPDTVRLSAHAVHLGAAGVLLLPPFYYKGSVFKGYAFSRPRPFPWRRSGTCGVTGRGGFRRDGTT